MGKTILTPAQHQFLEFVCAQPQITNNFYLTEGTALSEFYYRHRLSEDIDLFCEEKEIDLINKKAMVEFYESLAGELKKEIFLSAQ